MKLERKYPDLSQVELDEKAKREMFAAFSRVYDYIDNAIADIMDEVKINAITQQRQTRELGTLVGDFATKLIGDEVSNPLDVLSTSDGTVRSVGLIGGSPLFTITGSPIVDSGSFTLTIINQTKNKVLAGPITGASAAPTYRLLVSNDMPRTSSAADPSATELPNDGDWCVHKNTVSGFIYIAYNNAGTIVKLQLV